ncbi:hypothetical protein RHS01_02720 [Rhizoctonia solani]|uniref:Uncharacterized protein n=1 Tax=Rhizoctonia solani TaxID=456999 RepID=A0A8H7II28_9AGAM|nr:hypothetical protein RHS01_02720 [Rhizoctonia solani]
MSSMQLTTALNHAIAFLLNPLVAAHVEHRIIDALHIRLMGTLQRALFISAQCPPRVIKAACEDVGLLWGCWGPALVKSYGEMRANEEMELRVDPGKVEVCGPHGSKVLFEAAKARTRGVPTPSKNEFSIYEAHSGPFLLHPLLPLPRGFSTNSLLPRRSRSPARPLLLPVLFLASTLTRALPRAHRPNRPPHTGDPGPRGPLPSPALTVPPSPSDSDHGLDAFYIDTNRKEVTIYESGKVGVLGGAVMLGVPPVASSPSLAAAVVLVPLVPDLHSLKRKLNAQ